MKTCTFVICILLSAIASFATAPASGYLSDATNPGTAKSPALKAEPFSVCIEAENSEGTAPVTEDPNASNGKTRGAQNSWDYYVEYQANVSTAGKYMLTIRYYAEQNSLVNVSVNAAGLTQVELPASHSWNIAWKEHTIELDLSAGNNRIRIKELSGYNVRQDKICLTENGPSDPVCDFQIAPSTSGPRYELGATMAFFANCSGGDCNDVTFTWTGNGILRDGRSIGLNTPSTPGTYTYELFASKDGCANKIGSVTVEVVLTPGCDFNVSASASDATPNCSQPITLSSQCSGPDCAGVTYSWGGTGLNVSGASVNVPAPPASGTYNYFLFANKEGCRGKSSGVTVAVSCESGPTEPFSVCVEAEDSNSDGAITEDPNASNGKTRGTQENPSYFVEYEINGVKATGTHQVTLRYYAPKPTGITITVNGEMTAPLTGLAESGSWNVVWTEQTFSLTLKEGNNKIRIWSGFGYPLIRQDKMCVTGSGGTGNPPSCDFNVTTYASTLTPACSTSVSLAAVCSGFDCQSVSYLWSGQGTNSTFTSTSVAPPRANGTYTYTLTATKNACPPIVIPIQLTVSGCEPSGPFGTCVEAEYSASNGPTTSDPNASNGQTRGAQDNYNYYVNYYVPEVPTSGTYPVTLRYYSEANAMVSVWVNGQMVISTKELAASNSWNIVWREETFNVPLTAGNNTIRIEGLPGAACRQDKICVGNSQNNARMAVPEFLQTANDASLLQAFPNPASGEFKAVFHLKTGETGSMQITDVQGKIWHTRRVTGKGTHEERVNLGNAPVGIYLLQVRKPNSVETKKILLTR